MEDKYKKLFGSWKVTSTKILREREQQIRQCAVEGCFEQTKFISNYCRQHRLNSQHTGNPLRTKKQLRIEATELSKVATKSLTDTPSDLMLFDRVCKSLDRYRQHTYKSDKPTIIKYRQRYSNAYKAKLIMNLSLQLRTTQELLELSLGSALALYIHRDDLVISERSFGRLLSKTMVFPVVSSDFAQGERFETGRIISNILDETYGSKYWRNALIDTTIQIKAQQLNNHINQ